MKIAFGQLMLVLFFATTVPAQSKTAEKPESKDLSVKRGILPKEETGALRLLKKHPEYDGRGVTVAIFDTGVDPGADGLRLTPDGEVKVVDMIDGTGSGDVAMDVVRKPHEGTIEGKSGRPLRLAPHWLQLATSFRVGLKPGYELFNNEMIPRYRAARKKRFDVVHQRLIDQVEREIETAGGAKRGKLNARLAQLKAFANYVDPGPLFDCVVFHDGFSWRAVVDTDQDGDLRDELVLTNYRVGKRYGTFPEAEVNFGVNIYDNGKVLSIVTDAGAHGTHVAGIVGAYYKGQPERNGVAPGVKIVAVKIGDTRLDSMETGNGLVRGIRAVIENQCDLINMSYGEAASTANSGRIIDRFKRLVDKHGVIFVAAAGNEGPGMSTVIAPAASESVIGIGAYVSPAMAAVQYASRGGAGQMPYTWSSRGPAIDGGRTVDVYAPGGAIAPIPTWSLRPTTQMNGTSMASPNACGNLALLLSAAKQNGWKYTPELVRRCIMNSSVPVADGGGVAEKGQPGLMQIDKALTLLQRQQRGNADIGYRCTVSGKRSRGVYLREPWETKQVSTFSIRVNPIWPDGFNNADKIAFRLELAASSTADWVTCGEHVWVDSRGGRFDLRVDPRKLSPGAHFAEVLAVDARHPDDGPLFRIPVNAIVPIRGEGTQLASPARMMSPGSIQRHYIAVPEGASWADIELNIQDSGRRLFVLQAIQLLDGRNFRAARHEQYARLNGDTKKYWSIPVHGGRTMELCMAQFWSSLGEANVSWQMTFRGVVPAVESVTVRSGDEPRQVRVSSGLADQHLQPKATLTTLRTIVASRKATLRTLTLPRDRIDGERAYELQLDYDLVAEKPRRVTPRFPRLDDRLYEADLEQHIWQVFDQAGRLIGTDDAFPAGVSLPKGKNSLRLTLRHSDRAKLDRLRSLTMALDSKLPAPINVTVGSSLAAARRGQAGADVWLRQGSHHDFFVRPPTTASLSAAGVGDLLIGTITWSKPQTGQSGNGKHPAGLPLQVVKANVAKPQAAPASAKAATADSVKKAVTDFKLEQLRSMAIATKDEVFERLATELEKAMKDDQPVLIARLHRLDHVSHRKKHLNAVVKACDRVLGTIDQEAIVRSQGDPKGNKSRAAKQLEILTDTLYRKGRALGYMELPEVLKEQPIKNQAEHDKSFEANFKKLDRWVDTTSEKYFLLHVRRERRRQNYAAALQVLSRHMKSAAPNYWHYKKRHDLFNDLEWTHLAEYEAAWRILRFPNGK